MFNSTLMNSCVWQIIDSNREVPISRAVLLCVIYPGVTSPAIQYLQCSCLQNGLLHGLWSQGSALHLAWHPFLTHKKEFLLKAALKLVRCCFAGVSSRWQIDCQIEIHNHRSAFWGHYLLKRLWAKATTTKKSNYGGNRSRYVANILTHY